MMLFQELPGDVVSMILSMLSAEELLNLACCCSFLKHRLLDDSLMREKIALHVGKANAEQLLIYVVSPLDGDGKSCLAISCYFKRAFCEEYDPTIEDSYKALRLFKGRVYNIELMDVLSSEQECGHRYFMFYSRDPHAVFMCVDSTNAASVANLDMRRQWVERIMIRDDTDDIGAPIMMVGLKSDLERLHVEAAKAKAALWKVPYLECSSKTYEGVEELLQRAIPIALERRQQLIDFKKQKNKKKCVLH